MSPPDRSRPNDFVRVRCRIDPERWGGLKTEGFWAIPLNDGTFRIDNIPILTDGLALGDVVSCTYEDNELFVDKVLERSGNSTVRFQLVEECRSKDDLNRVSDWLEEADFEFEADGEGIYSVCVQSTDQLQELVGVLREQQREGVLSFEVSFHYRKV